jgi:transcriptional regulator with XRE-family HTH domain
MNQDHLAHRADISVVWLQKIEQGRARPKLDVLRRIAAVLGISAEELDYHVARIYRNWSYLIILSVRNSRGILRRISEAIALEMLNIRHMTAFEGEPGQLWLRIDYPTPEQWQRIEQRLGDLGDAIYNRRAIPEHADPLDSSATGQSATFITDPVSRLVTGEPGEHRVSSTHRAVPEGTELTIIIEANNRPGLVYELSAIFEQQGLDIKTVKTDTRVRRDRPGEEASIWLVIEHPSASKLGQIKAKIAKVQGINRVFCLTPWPSKRDDVAAGA